MTGKWTIKEYKDSDGTPLKWPWLLFAPGITPPDTFMDACKFGYPEMSMWAGKSQALEEIKTIRRFYGGDPT